MKKSKTKKIVLILILILILLVTIFIFKPYYKIEDRTKNIDNYSNDTDKVIPIGWLKVQGTNIDFPIMYYNDVEDIEDPTEDLGWSYEDNTKLVNRTVIFSHNVLNVSNHPLIADKNHRRFEQIMSFIYTDFVKKNKYIQYTINNKNNVFKIYGISIQKEENLNLGNLKKNEITSYQNKTKKLSYFDFDVDISKNDKLITLITCTRFFGDSEYSFVIDGRLLRKKELKNNYKIKENNNYLKIKKILEGDGSNE